MRNRNAAVIASALVAAALAACSSGPSSLPQLASTATVTINNYEVKPHLVKCGQLEWSRTIDIGGDASGAKLVINEQTRPLTTQSVRIHNMGGFTGMYAPGAGGDANLSFGADRFTITGTANGFNVEKPNDPASATFKFVVTC